MITKLLPVFYLIFITPLLFAQNEKTYLRINKKGEVLGSFKASSIYEFSNGLSRARKIVVEDNKWVYRYGYVDTLGNESIPFVFSDARDFKSNVDYVWVKVGEQTHYSLLHKSGKIIPTKKYTKVGYMFDFQPDIFAVYDNGRMGFIDTTGNEIIPCRYSGAPYFKEGLVSVALYDANPRKYGFINKKGEVVIPLSFKQGGESSFDGAYARVSLNGKTVLIDKKGNTVLNTRNGNIQSEGAIAGLVSVFNGPNRTNWGWVNLKDEIVIDLQYDYTKNFNEDGIAIVEKNGLKGAIDTTGRIIIPLKYESVYADISKTGYISCVYKSDEPVSYFYRKKDFFDSNLNLLKLEDVLSLHGSNYSPLIQFTTTDGKVGYMNRSFEIVIKAQYKNGTAFSHGLAWVEPKD